MGNEFCKGCQDNCLSGMLEENLSTKNKPEENIIYRNSEYMNSRTASYFYTQNQITDNNKYDFYITQKTPRIFTNSIDTKKLNDIKMNYYVRILVKYFRKFKYLKQKALNQIIVENYFISSCPTKESIINNKTNNNLDKDFLPKSNHIFIGHKFNNKKEGYGLEIYSDINARFFGQFKNGKKTGFCKFSIYNSEKSFYYFGETLNNKISGFGYYEDSKKGSKYEGEWKNSVRNGYGIEHYEEGSIYKGTFLNGKKHGIGVYTWMDKSFYEGEWYNNYINGHGKYIYSDGSVYLGSWYCNKMDGFGEFTYSSKRTYFGFFKNNMKSGFGIFFKYEEKKAYIGFWENNKQNGLGQFIHDKKNIYGIWKSGKLINKIQTKDEFFNKITAKYNMYLNNFLANDFSQFQERIAKLISL